MKDLLDNFSVTIEVPVAWGEMDAMQHAGGNTPEHRGVGPTAKSCMNLGQNSGESGDESPHSKSAWPPTLIVVHPKENRAKCSLQPLRGRSDLRFLDYPPQQRQELPQYVRLAIDGSALSTADSDQGILLIDGAWRHAAKMQEHFSHVPPRSLTGFLTAYPRVSKLFQDPAEGLASVEALYVAYRILGRPTDGMLDAYRWRDQFLQRNGWL
jgi:pre-rRNA-processing protein TSR3